jgi:hypothetical protein
VDVQCAPERDHGPQVSPASITDKAIRQVDPKHVRTDLAHSLTELGLIDEYRIYLHPVVLGHGKPYFAWPGRRSAL